MATRRSKKAIAAARARARKGSTGVGIMRKTLKRLAGVKNLGRGEG